MFRAEVLNVGTVHSCHFSSKQMGNGGVSCICANMLTPDGFGVLVVLSALDQGLSFMFKELT